MRSITTLTLTLVLGLTACPADKGETDTDTTASATVSPMTDPGTTTGGTTAEPGTTTTTPTTTGVTDSGTTAEPGTTTGGTTAEPGTTTGGTTAEPGTTTSDTTGGGAEESPYNACTKNEDCGAGSLCINSEVTGGAVKGNVCAPACDGDMCPDPAAGVAAMGGGQCLFGADPMNPTNCAAICVFGTDDCGPGSDCEDIGIPPQMGTTFGICTHPA